MKSPSYVSYLLFLELYSTHSTVESFSVNRSSLISKYPSPRQNSRFSRTSSWINTESLPKHYSNNERHLRSRLNTSNSLSVSISTCISIIRQITSSSPVASLSQLTDALAATPPSVYFLSLIAAGFGVPVSEDAMVIFIGTILPKIWSTDPVRRNHLLIAIYFGVVLSDFITFGIGKILRMGFAGQIRKRMDLRESRPKLCEKDDDIQISGAEELEPCVLPTQKAKKTDQILSKLEQAGDYVGFIIRFSVGARAPMMLFTGFSNRVPFVKYAVGTIIGAILSVLLQLLLGFSLRNNPAAVVGAIATISSIVLIVPFVVAVSSSIYHFWSRYQLRVK